MLAILQPLWQCQTGPRPSDSASRNSHTRSALNLASRLRASFCILLTAALALCALAGCSTNTTTPAASTAPSITNLSATSGAVGTSITITGTNFGATQGTSTVTFNSTAATVTSWSATSIVVTVPVGATTGNVVVTVGGVASNGENFVVPPIITSLSATSGAVNTNITINGSNFGATQGTSTVTFNTTAATTIVSWAAGAIQVTVPVGATAGNVVVTVSGVASNGVAFTPGPSLTQLSTGSAVVGASITITGVNFGATQGASTVTFAGTSATPTSWSNTSIAVPVPAGAAAGNVVVTVGGLASNGLAFTPGPMITSLSVTTAFVNASITINGTSFGATQGTSTVTFNGTAATVFSSWSATAIVVKVPIGATTGNVVVTVNGFASNGSPFTPGPSITGLLPNAGPVGTSVVISGTQFGATQGSSVVTFNALSAGTATSWSNTSITVNVPTGATTGGVVVTVNSLPSNTQAFTVGALTILPNCGNSPTGDESKLNGTYLFFVQGFSGAGNNPIGTIVSFQANGTGGITGGEGDTNSTAQTEAHYTITPTSTNGSLSKYTVGKDPSSSGDIGCVSLTNSFGTSTFEFSLGKASSGVYTKGRLIRFDDTTGSGTHGSGVLLKQTPASFGFPSASTNFVFGESGWTSTNDPFEGAGFVTVSTTGSFTNLSADFDLGPTPEINYGLGAASPILGVTNNNGQFNSAPDATAGYSTVTDNYTVSTSTETFHYAIYEVNPSEYFFLSTDIPSTTTPLTTGRAIVTNSSFSVSSLSGDYILHQRGTAVSGSTRTAEAGLGLLSFTPGTTTGTLGGTLYFYETGTSFTTETPSATYSINASSGRVALTSASDFGTGTDVPVFYIAAPNANTEPIKGFAVGTDADATFGLLEPSPGTGFTTAGLNGNYFLGTEDPGDYTVTNQVGALAITGGAGSCVGTIYQSSNSGMNIAAIGDCEAAVASSNGLGTVSTTMPGITDGEALFFISATSTTGGAVINIVETQ